MSKIGKLRQRLAGEEDWSDVTDEDFFNKPYKPRKMSIDLKEIDHMDSLHNEASWNAGQKAMKRFEKELSHPFSRKYALKNMNDHAFNSGTVLQNNYSDIERIMEKNDDKKLFSLLEGHNKDILDSSNFNIEREFGFGEESPRPTNKGEEMGRGIGEIFDRFKDEDYAKIPDRKGDMLKTKQIMSDYTNDVSGGIMKGFSKYRTSKLRQHLAQVRLAATEQQTIEGGIAPERVKGRPKKVASTKREVVNAMKEGKPMRTEKPFRHGERLPPTYETDGENFLLYGNKILSKQGNGYQTHVKGFINDDNYVQITLDSLKDFGIQVNSEGKIIPTKQFYTKNGLAMKIKTGGDLTKSDMIIPANEISDSRVLVNKYKPPTGIKPDTYPYTPENLRDFSAESRRRATSMQVNSEGKRVPEGTLKGDPTGIRKRSLSETATQPEDAKTVNKILGLPEEQGLEKTFGKRYDKEKTSTTYNKGKYKGIEGSKTHHILFKKKTGVPKPNPVARFKHTKNLKVTPKGSFASSPFANNPANAIQLSKPEHKELHRLNPHSNFRNIFESKLRLKIARIRQRNISRRVTQINMARDDSDPDRAWFEVDKQLDKLENTPGWDEDFTLHKGKLVNYQHERDTLDILDSVEGDPKHSMFTVSNTHDIVDRKDPQLKTKFNEFVKQGYNPTVGKWGGKFDATVNFRDKDRKQVEKIARGELNEFGKPIRAQQSYVETTEIPRKAPTGPRKFKTKFFNYNEKTDTYE